MKMNTIPIRRNFVLLACLTLTLAFLWVICTAEPSVADPLIKKNKRQYTTDFRLDACTFSTTGSNEYFILEPGYQLNLAGEEKGVLIELSITVLNETEMVGDIETRVVEEMEREDGELVEVSRNFFAICNETNSVFYFGEDVDIYEDGEIVSHEGAWRAFENGNLPGLIMPGIILLGARYFQEIAPEIALDRAEIVKMDATLQVPLDEFENVLVTLETSPLAPGEKDLKFYAPGVGLIKDEAAELIEIVNP
ncbi:MAG: hypothetical protein C4532_14095 [Candidatus Abyssobacteria bacterium SURF_17]|uniref:Uncharacterized protein n=1 Tax=Candidatus Abyssobacteria bacterium SURF_17 TaxID=2093361 RepID=A0A419EUC0_9BACT|nr:MAG: hypothetical protein C4532_14095 [Candidatus Abyssubacteria bacterium SURF_17]